MNKLEAYEKLKLWVAGEVMNPQAAGIPKDMEVQAVREVLTALDPLAQETADEAADQVGYVARLKQLRAHEHQLALGRHSHLLVTPWDRLKTVQALDAAIAELQRIPDSVTGLVPCGCGGKAKICPSDLRQAVVTAYQVRCIECAMTTDWVRGKQENAVKFWNTAMGWKGDV